MAARINDGDVFEISTEKGKAYFQVIEKDPKQGYLIGLIEGIFDSIPYNLEELVKNPFLIKVYFRVSFYVYHKEVTKIRNFAVNSNLKNPKFIRCFWLGKYLESGIDSWFVKDAQTLKVVEAVQTLSEEQKSYPLGVIWDIVLLRKHILKNNIEL